MIKGLEIFNFIKIDTACQHCQYYNNKGCNNKNDCFWKTLEQTLQRLESIDNANPSEALESLDRIIEKTDSMNNTCVHLPKCLKDNKCRYNIDDLMCPDYEMSKTIKQTLIKAQEQEKVLDIIKGKLIWVENDKLMCGRYADIEIELEEEDFENKEEFDLVKRYVNG